MYYQLQLTSTLLALAAIPTAFAASCSAVGSLDVNTAGGGTGGGAVSNTGQIALYKGDTLLTTDTTDNVCSDLVTISSSLAQTFSWGASCGVTTFSECHGAYDTVTHIDGDDPQSGTDFYGIGVNAQSECKVEFECED